MKMPRAVYFLVMLVLASLAIGAYFDRLPGQNAEVKAELNTSNLVIDTPKTTGMTSTQKAVTLATDTTRKADQTDALKLAADRKTDKIEDLVTDALAESKLSDLRDIWKKADGYNDEIEKAVEKVDDLRDKVDEERDQVSAIADFREVNETDEQYDSKQTALTTAEDAYDRVDDTYTDMQEFETRSQAAYDQIEARYNTVKNPAPATNTNENKTTVLDVSQTALVKSTGKMPTSLADITAGRNAVTTGVSSVVKAPTSLADITRGRG